MSAALIALATAVAPSLLGFLLGRLEAAATRRSAAAHDADAFHGDGVVKLPSLRKE